MCQSVALQLDNVPTALHETQQHRLYRREGKPELRFSFGDHDPELPVIHEGQFLMLHWGNKHRRARLPANGWCAVEQLEAGQWQWLRPEEVTIPANFGCEKGRWFLIETGVRGILVRDDKGTAHVYMLTEPATHYYEIMCRHNRMPSLIDQRI